MTWLRRAAADPHECPLPMRLEVITVTASLNPRTVAEPVTLTVIDGQHGDLWRCDDCSKTWRVGLACGICDAYGIRPHGGRRPDTRTHPDTDGHISAETKANYNAVLPAETLSLTCDNGTVDGVGDARSQEAMGQ